MSKLRLTYVIAAILGGIGILLSGPADAQRSRQYDRYDNRAPRDVAGQFDYYALVLSWSPTHCAQNNDRRNDLQCNRSDGRRYNFVLHGLWPQYERGYPNNCPTRFRPFVPDRVIDKMLHIMPAKSLIIHEYKKHGTCSGLEPEGYYDLARQLFNRIRIPERYVNPSDAQFVAPEQLMREIIAANTGLKPDMMAVSCGGPGNRLKEVRICYTKSGQLRPCGQNENKRRLCSARRMYIPPVRSTWTDPRGANQISRDKDRRAQQEKEGLPARPQDIITPRI